MIILAYVVEFSSKVFKKEYLLLKVEGDAQNLPLG